MLRSGAWSRQAGEFLLTSGAVLLGLALLPLLSSSPVFSVPSTQERQSLRAYVQRIQAGGEYELNEAVARVHAGTVHSDGSAVGLAENWLQFVLSRVYPPLARSQNTARLIEGGEGDCSERSQILKTISEAAGLPCRFVGLGGHVVLEVQVAGAWQIADADYGVVFPVGLAVLEQDSAEPLIRDKLALARHSPDKIQTYAEIVQSRGDNVTLPVGMPLSPRLHLAELACDWLVWLLPLACLVMGAMLRIPLFANRMHALKAAASRPARQQGRTGVPVVIGGALR